MYHDMYAHVDLVVIVVYLEKILLCVCLSVCELMKWCFFHTSKQRHYWQYGETSQT